MDRFVFTQEPPSHWSELCSHHGDLFNTPQWHTVLSKGFGSDTLYGWNEAASTGVTITVFKAGPFRIGYLGFPVGGTMGNGTINPDMIEALRKTAFPNSIHCLRIPVSAFDLAVDLPLPAQMTPETAIENLQGWRPEIDPRLHRDVKKAENSSLITIDAAPSQGEVVFRLYRDTIARHHGSMRYTLNYFCELNSLAKTSAGLRCLLAIMDSEITGFLVVACHNRTAYYLHGGMFPEYKQHTPSDLLLYEAIKWARQQGMESFNMMASPSKQPSLIRYKEKWGGVTRGQQTYELVLHPFQSAIFKAATALHQRMSTFRLR